MKSKSIPSLKLKKLCEIYPLLDIIYKDFSTKNKLILYLFTYICYNIYVLIKKWSYPQIHRPYYYCYYNKIGNNEVSGKVYRNRFVI